jgi:hypothetical protein
MPGHVASSAPLHSWELVALFCALLGGCAAAMFARRWPERVGWARRFEHPWGWDVALVLGGLLVNLPPLFGTWHRLSPFRSPYGPDSDMNFFAAMALFRGDLTMYGEDRYPAFAWLAAALAPDAMGVAEAGVFVSMASGVLLGPLAYALGRSLGGRAAGFAGLCLALHLPAVADLGRQFTPYALVAAADLLGVVSLVALLSRGGARRVALATAAVVLASAVAFTSEPKQLPVALAFVALGAPLLLWRGRLGGWVAAALLVGALPLLNQELSTAKLPILSLEAITARVPLGLDISPELGVEGWSPGEPISQLLRSLHRVAALVKAPASRGFFHPHAARGMEMQLPQTSLLWLVLLVGLLARSRGRPRLAWVGMLPVALVAYSTLHLHFQHRYALPFVVVLPALAAAGLSRLGGAPMVWSALGVALVWPGSPWATLAPGVLNPAPREGDGWSGVEPDEWGRKAREADKLLAADAFVLDYAQSRPWTMITAVRPYVRCTATRDTCRSRLAQEGTLYAILWPGESVSPKDAPDAASLAEATQAPATVGDCWTRVLARPENGAVYQWTCPERPIPPKQAPPSPQPQPPAAQGR